jgi:hypothetical protein
MLRGCLRSLVIGAKVRAMISNTLFLDIYYEPTTKSYSYGLIDLELPYKGDKRMSNKKSLRLSLTLKESSSSEITTRTSISDSFVASFLANEPYIITCFILSL